MVFSLFFMLFVTLEDGRIVVSRWSLYLLGFGFSFCVFWREVGGFGFFFCKGGWVYFRIGSICILRVWVLRGLWIINERVRVVGYL